MKLKTKFQDEDFELGEVVDEVIVECLGKHEKEIRVIATAAKGGQHTFSYDSIKKFTDDWEDVPEEPKGSALDFMILTLTNFIENEPDEDKVDLEDCKQMLEKLKAWKRLKGKGFEFRGGDDACISYSFDKKGWNLQILQDFELLFSGEDD